ALIRRDDAVIGLDSPAPRRTLPYSVSIPHTFRMAILNRSYPGRPGETSKRLQILPRRDPLDGPPALGVVAIGQKRADVNDPLTLLARDLRPVVRVGGVRQILVLFVLLADRREEVGGPDSTPLVGDPALDGELLGPLHDVHDHGTRREVLEVQDLFVAVLVRHLEEPVRLVL